MLTLEPQDVRMRILVVGVDAETAAILEREGQVTREVSGAQETFRVAGQCDLIVLGSKLEQPRAHALCRGLRASSMGTAILLLIKGDAAAARVEALDAGADDCVSVPFLAEELLARVRALARRSSGQFGPRSTRDPSKAVSLPEDKDEHPTRAGRRT